MSLEALNKQRTINYVIMLILLIIFTMSLYSINFIYPKDSKKKQSSFSHFLGTKTSSFTLAITEERIATFGHPPTTAAEMDDLPPAGKDEL